MLLNLPLPDWVPWWGQLVVLILGILFGFAFLMMPFAVFGLKGRLDFLEAQLDDIHAELRMVATRLPDADRVPAREPVFEELIRPPPLRSPSPPQMPVQRPAQMPEQGPEQRPRQMSAPVPPPTGPTRQTMPPSAPAPDAFRATPRAPSPPRFAGATEPQRQPPVSAPPQRFPARDDQRTGLREGGTSGDWDDGDAPPVPRRPLRATTLRDPGRDPGRDFGREPGRDLGREAARDPARDPGRDQPRSEPTLRWPPR